MPDNDRFPLAHDFEAARDAIRAAALRPQRFPEPFVTNDVYVTTMAALDIAADPNRALADELLKVVRAWKAVDPAPLYDSDDLHTPDVAWRLLNEAEAVIREREDARVLGEPSYTIPRAALAQERTREPKPTLCPNCGGDHANRDPNLLADAMAVLAEQERTSEARKCPICGGEGAALYPPPRNWDECGKCNGTGVVAP